MTKKIKNLVVFICLVIAVFAAADFAWAASVDVGLDQAAGIGLGAADPRAIAANIIRILFGFLGITAVGLIIYAGWLYMTAAGEEEKVEKAKKILIGAVIGLVICLASFAIASFILSRLIGATTGGGDGASNDATPIIGGGGYSFNITATSPYDQATGVVRNAAVKVFFNSAIADKVTQTILDSNFKVEKIAAIDPATEAETAVAAQLITGTSEIVGGRMVISFKDSDSCGDEKGTLNCLPAWSKFKVTVNGYSGLVSINNQSLSCSAGAKCDFVFSTSNLVDSAAPEPGILSEQICRDDGSLKPDANTVSGWAKDDVGLAAIKFYQKKDGQETEQEIFSFPGNGRTYQQENYQYDASALAVGDKYNFGINAFDLADHRASSSFSATIKPGHCCNGEKDADETEIDCGGKDCLSCAETAKPVIFNVSPQGGFCSADKNKFCSTDADCGLSGACNLDTPNGAAGNFVTISGRYFGAAAGKAFFNDNKQAVLADTINKSCSSPWQDSQIIAVRPTGAENGPIKIVSANGNFDTTADNRGPAINNFLVNTIKRPGLCLVKPNNGFFKDIFNLQGNGFGVSAQTVLFGNSADNVAADNIANWSDTSADAAVPNIKEGRNAVFVRADKISSNDLAFTVRSNTATAPVIEYLEPTEGPAGQYITIYGRNFKTYQAGKSAVKFYLPADPANLILADTDFPDACKNNWWHDKYIIVKAPRVASDKLGDYKVVVITGEGRQSAPADFKITTGNPGPGACALEPHNGPVGQAVKVSGNNFGFSQGDNGRAVFYSNLSGAISGWADLAINTSVPNGAQTGPFKVVNNDSKISNSLPFTVGKCSTNAACEAGEECCAAGTYWQGICQTAGTCSLGGAKSCVFGWTFTAASAAPGAGGQGTPCVDDNNCASGLYCNSLSKTCQPKGGQGGACSDPNSCQDGLYCDGTSQTCQQKIGQGGACTDKAACQDGLYCDGTSQTCQQKIGQGGACTDNAACQDGLYCDGTSKTCQSGGESQTFKVIDYLPQGDNTCRNSLIQATFNQPMQTNTLSSNIILVGDYGTSQCPANTKYLTSIYKPTFLGKIKFLLAKIPLVNKLTALEARAVEGNFCSIAGSLQAVLTADKKTAVELKPQQVLEANRKYYVIIKSDTNLADAASDGVMSASGKTLTGTVAEPLDEKTFNGVIYKGKIWDFTTKDSSSSNGGVCQIDSVRLNPHSYLFNTVINDLADDSDLTLDSTVKDSDKVFRATAYSIENQPITAIENIYNWRWDWSIDDQSVVKFKNGANALDDNPTQTLLAQNVKEAKTLLHAKATITQDKVGQPPSTGSFKENTASVYVFQCANLWPSFKTDGSGNLIWEPWRDNGSNCTTADKYNCGVSKNESCCYNTNYELYYCRDAGGPGTADDLPAIQSDNAVIRPYSAEQDILKEFYFFRQDLPD